MATKTRRTHDDIRRERRSSRNAIAAELERLQKENAELRTKVDLLMQGRAEYNAKLLAFDAEYAGWDYLDAACDVISRAAKEQLRAEQAEGERDAMRATWIDPASYAEVMDGYALTLAQSQTQLDAARAQVQRLREALEPLRIRIPLLVGLYKMEDNSHPIYLRDERWSEILEALRDTEPHGEPEAQP